MDCRRDSYLSSNYKDLRKCGEGAFSKVFKAVHTRTGIPVAIKILNEKYSPPSWRECIGLKEVQLQRSLDHPNVIKLKEVVREGKLYLVFEFMEHNLLQLLENRTNPLTESEIQNFCFQIFSGLDHMHERGFFHRDMKPENLLVTGQVIKIADLGSAREFFSDRPYTEYIATRWYRAPEILLKSCQYGPAVDMWAMGAIMAEMFTGRAIFPGKNEVDQVHKICAIMGAPTETDWPLGHELANALGFKFPQYSPVPVRALLPTASDEAIDLINSLLSWDPNKRPTAAQALQHPFFTRYQCAQPCLYSSLASHSSRECIRPAGDVQLAC